MIINLNQFGGGGGGGYVLPVASQSTLGGVKIGDGVNIDSAGTISVQSSDPTILKSVSALPLTAESGDVCVFNDKSYVYTTQSGVTCSVYNNRVDENENVTEHIIQWYGDLPSGEALFSVYISVWGETYYMSYDSANTQFVFWNNIAMLPENLIETLPADGEKSGVLYGTLSWRCYNNVINMYGVEFNYVFGIYGNWNQVSGSHWEPIDWQYNVAYPRKFLMDYNTMPRATTSRMGVVRVGSGLSVDFNGILSANLTSNYNEGIGCSATTYGFAIDMKYINEAYTGDLGHRDITDGNNDYDFGLTLNADGTLKWLFVDLNQYIEVASGTIQTEGTSTICQDEDYETTISWSGNTVEIAFANTSWGSGDFRMPNIPILSYQANGTTYYVKQR